MIVLVIIIATECREVAIFNTPTVIKVRMCRVTFIANNIDVSDFGLDHVFRMVGTKAMRSMPTATITVILGLFVNHQGMRPKSARARKI